MMQAMELHPEARELIESDAHAHMATVNPDGSPQLTLVWVGLEGDEIVSAHLFANRKVQNVQRDPRVSISIEGEGAAENGLRRYLGITGRARLEEGGAPELLQRLAHTYMGPGVKFPPMDDPPAGYVIRTTPERVHGSGPWAPRR
jgi:PPOX class probable F420-dependent enzyme